MTAPDWTAIATRFHAAAAKLIPLSARMSGVAKRLTPSTCPECGHPDCIHWVGCSRAMAGTGNTALQFGRAVVRAERRLTSRRALHALLHDLGQATVVGMGRCERCPS